MSSSTGFPAAAMLARRELVRFIRQPIRIIAAVLTPLVLWGLLGAGFARGAPSEMLGGAESYAGFMLPGVLGLITVFAAVFASISLIEDRNEGFLRSVLVSPAPRWSIAAGKAFGGALTAWFQALLFLPFVLIAQPETGVVALLLTAGALLLVAFAISALSLTFAWRSATGASFHSVMNLLLMPMWLLSGALFPVDTAAGWLRALMLLNPLHWMTELVRETLAGELTLWSLAITLGWMALFLGGLSWVVTRGQPPSGSR